MAKMPLRLDWSAAREAQLEHAGPDIRVSEADPIWKQHAKREEERTPTGRMTYRDMALAEAKRAEIEGRHVFEVPCPGSLRLEADDGEPHRSVQCDVCGEEMCVPRSTIEPALIGQERLARSQLPIRLLGVEFERTEETELPRKVLRIFIQQWNAEERSKPPALYGEPGRGKTHLLTLTTSSIIREYLARALYWASTDLLDVVKASFDSRHGCPEWEAALNIPLLVLDDLGAERLTDWSRERLAALIDHRYRLGLPMLVATNIPPAEWPAEFGARTASRLAGMTKPVEVTGRDRRQDGPSAAPKGLSAPLATTTANDASR